MSHGDWLWLRVSGDCPFPSASEKSEWVANWNKCDGHERGRGKKIC